MKQKVQAKGQPQRWKLIKPLVEAKVIGLFRLIRLSKRIRASDICGVAIKAGKKKNVRAYSIPNIYSHIISTKPSFRLSGLSGLLELLELLGLFGTVWGIRARLFRQFGLRAVQGPASRLLVKLDIGLAGPLRATKWYLLS